MNPTIEHIIDEDSTLRFKITNINSSLINAIRRIILTDIPCFVFRTFPYSENKIYIEKNTTRHNNEIIKQRLSCIPIHISDMEFPYEDYQLEIDKINDSESLIYLKTNDFKIYNKKTKNYLSDPAVKKIFPANNITQDFIIVARLQPQLADNIPGEELN